MNKALNVLKDIKNKLSNNQINNGYAFYILKTNKDISGSVLQFDNTDWIDLKHFNDYQMDRIRIAKQNHDTSLMTSIAYDFDRIKTVREYSQRDCSLISNSHKHPLIVSRDILIKLINKAITDAKK